MHPAVCCQVIFSTLQSPITITRTTFKINIGSLWLHSLGRILTAKNRLNDIYTPASGDEPIYWRKLQPNDIDHCALQLRDIDRRWNWLRYV